MHLQLVILMSNDKHSEHTYDFKVGVDFNYSATAIVNKLLVDCGATAHMINSRDNFINPEDNFKPDKHFIELADGTRTPGVVQGKGTETIGIRDTSGRECKLERNNALFVPTFKQNIFSVHAASEKGAVLSFEQDSACLKSPDGTKFPIESHGRLFYLNSISNNSDRSDEEWHKVLGHCNYESLFK